MGPLFALKMFGCDEGNWGYCYVQPLGAATFIVALAGTLVLLPLTRLSVKGIQRYETSCLALWLVVAFLAHVALQALAPYTLSAVVESTAANSFYTVARQYSAWEILTQFHSLCDAFPLHARANLPGKILFFHLLAAITSSTAVMGYLTLLFSDLGGLVIYFLARQWYQNRLTALYAMILYLFLPARLFMVPLMNTVTPVPTLLALLLFVVYLQTKADRYLGALGAVLYVLFLFEPLPFVTGLIFLGMIGKHLAERDLTGLQLLKIVVYVIGSWLAMHLLFQVIFGFNVLDAFRDALDDARSFNVIAGRPYWIWVVHNLKDFFLNMGITQSFAYLAALAGVAWQLASWAWRKSDHPTLAALLTRGDVLLVLTFSCVLAFLDLAGVNRGETVRLWIFLGVIMQMIAAHYWAGASRLLFPTVLTITFFQTAICLTRIGFIQL
jgi:hypothetical protein